MSYSFCRVLPETASLTDYDYGVILIGMAGLGKSSVINSMINTALDRNLQNLLIALPSQNYTKVSPEFNINTQDFKFPKIYEFSGPLTDYKKIRVVEIPDCDNENSSINEHFSNYFAKVSKYLNFVSIIGIVETSSTNRITPDKRKLYSSIKTIFSKNCLDNSFCFFITHHVAHCFEASFVNIESQLNIKINNNIYSYSTEEYKENDKLRNKIEKNLTKIKQKFVKFFKVLVKFERISWNTILSEPLSFELLKKEHEIISIKNQHAEILDEQRRKSDQEKQKLIKELEIYKNKFEEQKNKLNEVLYQNQMINQKYSKICSEHEECKKIQDDKTVKIAKAFDLYENFNQFLSNLENKIVTAKCDKCINPSAYKCTLHIPHVNICNSHIRLHIGDEHKLMRLFDTEIEIQDLDAQLSNYAQKAIENKQKIISITCNAMVSIKRLSKNLIEKFDELFIKIIAMRTIGKPKDFDFTEIDCFDEMTENNFFLEWLIESLRKN
ncbi:hypothetical protein SteCoe_13092 [Stentor coeruleus]|uniref:G domain-containing protein n=1 Tax=Stentor coeruleus TaxID=5963 RepID=A0A1R2C969_9CILI|nr:hypothetical protein SteCoe_13092 [Stentor coeruleus]